MAWKVAIFSNCCFEISKSKTEFKEKLFFSLLKLLITNGCIIDCKDFAVLFKHDAIDFISRLFARAKSCMCVKLIRWLTWDTSPFIIDFFSQYNCFSSSISIVLNGFSLKAVWIVNKIWTNTKQWFLILLWNLIKNNESFKLHRMKPGYQ